MAYEFNHVHLKAPDPKKTADWYVQAFNFNIVSDAVRASGDRFIRCQTTDGVVVNISGARLQVDLTRTLARISCTRIGHSSDSEVRHPTVKEAPRRAIARWAQDSPMGLNVAAPQADLRGRLFSPTPGCAN